MNFVQFSWVWPPQNSCKPPPDTNFEISVVFISCCWQTHPLDCCFRWHKTWKIYTNTYIHSCWSCLSKNRYWYNSSFAYRYPEKSQTVRASSVVHANRGNANRMIKKNDVQIDQEIIVWWVWVYQSTWYHNSLLTFVIIPGYILM